MNLPSYMSWSPQTTDNSAWLMDSVYQPMLQSSMGEFTEGYVSPYSFTSASLLPDYANMGNWGGPATTFSGKLVEGWNGLTNTVSNTASNIAASKPVQSFLNMPGTDQLNALAGVASSLNGIWNGYNQNRMMKDQFKFQKDAFNKQYQASVNQYNTQLEDRQRARVASNPNAYQSVSDYMAKNRVK